MAAVVCAVHMCIGWQAALVTAGNYIIGDSFTQAVIKYKIFPDEFAAQSFFFDLPCILDNTSFQVEDMLKSLVKHEGGCFFAADTSSAIHDDVPVLFVLHHFHRHR